MKCFSFFSIPAFLLFLSSCAHTPADFSKKPFVLLRFQNMVGLQTEPTGCSLGGLGGLVAMENYATAHPVDLSFQVGPAFSPLINGPFSVDELARERVRVWESWKKQGVSFYAVDAEDLVPSVSAFTKIAPSSAELLSTNLINPKNKEPLFKTDWTLRVSGKSLWVLSFSEPKQFQSEVEVVDPLLAFSKKISSLPKDVEGLIVLGALKKETRKALSKITSKPLLFLGGTIQEKNTTQIERIDKDTLFGRSPSFGTGFSEIVVGNFETDALGKRPQQNWAGFLVSFYSKLLNEKEKSGASCVPSSASK